MQHRLMTNSNNSSYIQIITIEMSVYTHNLQPANLIFLFETNVLVIAINATFKPIKLANIKLVN